MVPTVNAPFGVSKLLPGLFWPGWAWAGPGCPRGVGVPPCPRPPLGVPGVAGRGAPQPPWDTPAQPRSSPVKTARGAIQTRQLEHLKSGPRRATECSKCKTRATGGWAHYWATPECHSTPYNSVSGPSIVISWCTRTHQKTHMLVTFSPLEVARSGPGGCVSYRRTEPYRYVM